MKIVIALIFVVAFTAVSSTFLETQVYKLII